MITKVPLNMKDKVGTSFSTISVQFRQKKCYTRYEKSLLNPLTAAQFSPPMLRKFLLDYGNPRHVKICYISRSRNNSDRYLKLYIKGKTMACFSIQYGLDLDSTSQTHSFVCVCAYICMRVFHMC